MRIKGEDRYHYMNTKKALAGLLGLLGSFTAFLDVFFGFEAPPAFLLTERL